MKRITMTLLTLLFLTTSAAADTPTVCGVAVLKDVQVVTDKTTPDAVDRDGDSERPAGETPLPVPVIEEVC